MRTSRRSLLKNSGFSLVALGLGSRAGNGGEPPVLGGTAEWHGGGGAIMLILRGIAGHFAGKTYPPVRSMNQRRSTMRGVEATSVVC
jgi:hypothetical protein